MTGLDAAAAEISDGLAALVGVLDERLGDVSALVGPQGDKGDKGDPGRDGIDGKNGVAGRQGPPGKAGRDGADGAAGVDGSSGRAGKAGAKGEPGPRGFAGDPGPRSVRSVVEQRDPAQRIEFVRQYLDNGSSRRLVARRDAVGRLTELVEVSV